MERDKKRADMRGGLGEICPMCNIYLYEIKKKFLPDTWVTIMYA